MSVAKPVGERVVVVTGASSGVGWAAALAFGQRGPDRQMRLRTHPRALGVGAGLAALGALVLLRRR